MFDPATFQILFIFGWPALALLLEARFRPFAALGAVVMAYGGGIVLALSPFSVIAEVSERAIEASIPLAIPLLLFSLNVRAWLRHARTTMFSFLLAVCAVVFAACAVWLAARSWIAGVDEVVSMLVGMYVGGAPNMAVVAAALEISPTDMLRVNAADMALGAGYFLFLTTFAARVFGKVLVRRGGGNQASEPVPDSSPAVSVRNLFLLLAAVALSGACVALSIFLSNAATGGISISVVVFVLTVCAVVCSLFSVVRSLPFTYPAGYFLVLVFCTALGSMVDVQMLLDQFGAVFIAVAAMFALSVLLHLLLARLFRIDRDTFVITSTAAIYGPAFIPPVARALGDRSLVLGGLASGLVGYAIGSNAGIAVAWFLRLF